MIAAVAAFALNHWRWVAIAAAALGLWLFAHAQLDRAYQRGRADLIAEQARQIKENDDAATAADEASRRCQADPACRLANDGYRRD